MQRAKRATSDVRMRNLRPAAEANDDKIEIGMAFFESEDTENVGRNDEDERGIACSREG